MDEESKGVTGEKEPVLKRIELSKDRKPKDLNTTCPDCDSNMKWVIEEKELERAVNGNFVKFKIDWWVIKCQNSNCGMSFTTTESDEISLDNWNKKEN